MASALSWATIFSLAGYLFGKSASLFLEDVGRYEHYLVLILMGCVMSAWLAHLYHAWNIKKTARTRLARIRALRAARSLHL
jgi:membrane protein DedA with SNARE-associated domain